MTDTSSPILPMDLPRTIAEMIAYNAARMRRFNPKTDEEIAEMEDHDRLIREDEFDDRPLHRLTEEGIAEQIDATVERRGLQKVG